MYCTDVSTSSATSLAAWLVTRAHSNFPHLLRHCRAEGSVRDAEKEIKAAVGGESLQDHVLYVAQGRA